MAMIEPIEVNTSFAFYELVKISKGTGVEPVLVRFGDVYRVVADGGIRLEVNPKGKRQKSSLFFLFEPTDYGQCSAVRFDGVIDFMISKGWSDIMTWFLFNVGMFI